MKKAIASASLPCCTRDVRHAAEEWVGGREAGREREREREGERERQGGREEGREGRGGRERWALGLL